MIRAASALFNALVTIAVGPGILAHEYAHLIACKLTGVEVHERPALRLFESDAILEHDPVETFVQDYAIAVAPLVGNSTLALCSFALMRWTDRPVSIVPLWLGITFGLTALPSNDDTASLLPGVRTLPASIEPLGYFLAIPLRVISYSVFLGGLFALFWTISLATVATLP